MAAEEAAFRARAEARAAAAAAAEAADAPAEEASEGEGEAPAEEDPSAPVTLSVTPKGAMRVPDGYSTDSVMLDTPSGAALRFRALLPVPGASR